MAVTYQEVAELYVATFNRAPDAGGLDYWVNESFGGFPTIDKIAMSFFDQPETQALYPADNTDEEFVIAIYQNLFNREPDEEGLAYWTGEGGLGGGMHRSVMILAVANGATGTDAEIIANKTEVGLYYAGLGLEGTNFSLAGVTEDPATVAAAIEAANDLVPPFVLTQMADNLTGTMADDVFFAPVTQNLTGSGALANTFETGDILDGGAGQDILRVDLIATGTIQDNFAGAAIGATTTSIEEVYLTAITPQNDLANNTTFVSTIDAGRMSGVEQWWTDESRSDIRIEDVRTRPEDTTLGMRLTDPGVSYEVYFNPLFMEGDLSSESALTVRVQEITDGLPPANFELENITVREINFDFAGVSYTLDTEDMRAANTWAELEAAIADALLAQEDLAGLSVTHTGNGVFVIEDPTGGVFAIEDGEALIFGAAADIDVRNRVDVGRITEEGMTSSTLVADGVGAGSRGGIVNIAAMSGDRGVEVLNVLVDRDSHITTLASVNSPNTVGRSFDNENQLEEVYLTHIVGGAQGDFKLGSRTEDTFGVSTTTDDRLQTNGLTDVRVFDATGFTSELKLGASLTINVLDKYLLGVSEPVQFSYLLGDGGSNLNLLVNNIVAGDPDFLLEVIGGAEADRINLQGLAVKENTTIDGGGDDVIDTLEVQTSTGWAATAAGADIVVANPLTDLTAAETSFASVTNIEKLVINSALNTTHDLVAGGLGDVDDIIIATQNVNTRLVNLDADEQTVTVSGKNQTLGAGNNNNNQNFGTIRFTDTTGEELDLQLANTARVSGVLTVAALTIDNQVGNVSEVRTLNLDSAGVRNTSNVITTLNGNLVNSFILEGTQNLTITNLASASNSVAAAAASRDSLLVDGSGMGTFDPETGDLVDAADLYLGVTGAVITAIDAALGTNRTVELIGTDGDADILNIRDGVTTTNATTISEFETIRFGQGAAITVATNFNATNVSDVELYDLVDSAAGGTINLFNLRATENVQINAGNTITGTEIRDDVTLAAANPTAGSQVNVNFTTNETTAGFVGNFWQAGGANLNVQDFQTISVDMGGTTGQSYNYNFNLNTLANPGTGNVNARTLEITGGLFDIGYLNTDSLTLNELDTALTTVDFSGYAGDFITQGWDSTQGTNASVVVNEFGMIFDVGGNNTVFAVGIGAGLAPVAEAQAINFDLAGNLDAGASIEITFAGSIYVFTNDTGAAITAGNINAAIKADAATNSPQGFNIADGNFIALEVGLFASKPGDMPLATVAIVDQVTPPPSIAQFVDIPGELNNLLGGAAYDLVTEQSEFITQFVFTQDVYDAGVVWQIDNFQAIAAGDNVTISNQTQLDLRTLGVDSSTKINISAGDVFFDSLDADSDGILTIAELGGYATYGNTALIQGLTANDTVITSNEGLNYTIVLQGVDVADLQNENIVGIA